MRCKNCGSENDDNLYICQNCGSPLYDEDKPLDDELGGTQVFNPVDTEGVKKSNAPKNDKNDENDKKKKQQTIAIIVILAIVLIAIIVGIIVAVAGNGKSDDETTTELTTISTTAESTTQSTTATTTETTTTTTTETTTETTTTAATTFNVTLSCNDGGEVEGDGTYKRGKNITVIARADDGYTFDGWYKGSTKVSSNTKYTFTVTENVNLEAVFVIDSDIDTISGVDD